MVTLCSINFRGIRRIQSTEGQRKALAICNRGLRKIDKAIELCKIFHCTLDNLFREEMNKKSDAYTDLRVEEVEGFRYITYTVVSSDPEGDALDRVIKIAKENGVEHPRVVGWDFPNVSVEQANVYNMHGYTAAWILPEGLTPEGEEIKEQTGHKYAAIHIEKPLRFLS